MTGLLPAGLPVHVPALDAIDFAVSGLIRDGRQVEAITLRRARAEYALLLTALLHERRQRQLLETGEPPAQTSAQACERLLLVEKAERETDQALLTVVGAP